MWQSGFANNPAGDFGNYYGCMAIDSQDNLHCAWFHRVALSGSRLKRTTHYNRYEAAKSSWGTEKTITSLKYELNQPCITVDEKDYVWIAKGSTSSWKSVLDRSDLPFASDGNFTQFTPAFASSASSQKVSLVADKKNRIHITYYENGSTGGAGVKHKWIDPNGSPPTWTFKALSDHSGAPLRADYYSKLSADDFGNVYVIYNVDDQDASPNQTPPRDGPTETYVRKWDGSTQTWGNPVLVNSVPALVWHPGYKTNVKDHNDGRMITGACDETTGEFYFTYRDFASGDFVLGRWRGDDTESHTIYAKLMNTSPLPPATRNYFFIPHMRGSLWPKTNRTSEGLHLMYVAGDQTATTPVYTDYLESFPIASMSSTGTPKIGTKYPLDLNSVNEGGQTYVAALTASGLMAAVQVNRRFIPLVPDSLFYLSLSNLLPTLFINFYGTLGPAGKGLAEIDIPVNSNLVGASIDGCFVTYDTTSGIRAISNPWNILITN